MKDHLGDPLRVSLGFIDQERIVVAARQPCRAQLVDRTVRQCDPDLAGLATPRASRLRLQLAQPHLGQEPAQTALGPEHLTPPTPGAPQGQEGAFIKEVLDSDRHSENVTRTLLTAPALVLLAVLVTQVGGSTVIHGDVGTTTVREVGRTTVITDPKGERTYCRPVGPNVICISE